MSGSIRRNPATVRGRTCLSLAWLVPVTCLAHGTAVQAQQNTADLEEVIVTAQKRSERLQDVPVPVTAISAESLVENGQLQLQDYYTKVPGLGLALSGDTDSPWITIRGITTGGFTNPTVGTVIDDVPYGGTVVIAAPPSPPDVDPSDLERVEVLRGPQGTLYGASSMGGLLKFVTIDPSTERLSGRLQAGLSGVEDGDTGHSLRGAVNVPLSDELAVRASGFTSREAGYVDNVLTGQDDVNRRESEGGRVSALWRPSDTLSLKLSALIQDSDRLGGNYVDSSLGSGLQHSAVPDTGTYGRNTQAYSALLTASLGTVDLTSATGYSIDKLTTNADLSPLLGSLSEPYGVSGMTLPVKRRTEKFTQELRANVQIGERVQWLFGAFYTKEDAEGGGTFTAVELETGVPVAALYTNDSPNSYEEFAAFTNLTFQITQKLDVQFGGRISDIDQTFAAMRTGPLAVLFFGSDPSILPETRVKDDVFTFLVTPRLKISEDLMAYVRVASGYRPGGLNLGCGFTPCSVDPDTTQNYEIGLKGNVLNNTISFDASVYYIDWKDMQATLTANGFSYQANASRAKSQGVEFSLEGRPFQGFTAGGWVAWNVAELTRDFPATSTASGQNGDRLPYSSRWSANMSLKQEFPIGGIATAFVGSDASYVGDRKGLFLPGTARETFPSYVQVDLRTGVKYEQWTANAFVNNLSDKRGILRGGLDANGPPSYFSYIQPRTFGVSLMKTF